MTSYAKDVKRSLVLLLLLASVAPALAQKSDNIANVQNRLKAQGFYSGDATGILDSETSAALRRFQGRHGLAATGKLDARTARELNASAPKPTPDPTPQALAGSWHRLENGEMQFVEQQPAPTPALPPATAAPAVAPVRPSPASAAATANVTQPPAEGPLGLRPVIQDSPPPPSAPAPSVAAQPSTAASASGFENPDRLRDYVEAFVQAGLDQRGSEVKFFADRVDYFGRPDVPWQEVQRDLVQYDKKWPRRRFWIDGNIQIQQQNGSNEIKLLFPLRYELHNGGRYATGKVLKSLTIVKTPSNDLLITGVNEWKAPDMIDQPNTADPQKTQH